MTPNYRTGTSSQSWPQDISDSETLPIVTGIFDCSSSSRSLIDSANKLIEKYKSEWDWFGLIAGWKNSVSSPMPRLCDKSYTVKIEIVDGITKNIARIHYKVKGKHILYYDTWWLLDTGKWQVISPAEAETEILTGAGN